MGCIRISVGLVKTTEEILNQRGYAYRTSPSIGGLIDVFIDALGLDGCEALIGDIADCYKGGSVNRLLVGRIQDDIEQGSAK